MAVLCMKEKHLTWPPQCGSFIVHVHDEDGDHPSWVLLFLASRQSSYFGS